MARNRKDKPRTRRSIFRKSAVLSWTVVTLTVALFVFSFVLREKRIVNRHLAATARVYAAAVDHIAGERLLEDDYSALTVRGEGEFLGGMPEVEYLAVRRADGFALVYAFGRWQRGNGIAGWTPEDQGQEWEMVSRNPVTSNRVMNYIFPMKRDGKRWGTMHVGMSLQQHNATILGTYRVTGTVAAGALGLGLLASFFFAREISNPINRLKAFTCQVASGNNPPPVELDSNDELAELAESVNVMTTSLNDSQNKLKNSLEKQATLREKEVLLREIHHRVKNNMQILSSLIRLQSRRADTQQLKNILRESEARIRSMALIHEKLYQSDSLSRITMKGYLGTLTGELLRLHSGRDRPATVDIHAEQVQLGLDTAMPCGLIINELASNSLKYAFPEGRAGKILISLAQISEGAYRLIVWDNGVGIPPEFNIAESKSLGLRLVRMLVDQLNGTLEFKNGEGTRVEVTFKESHYRKRV